MDEIKKVTILSCAVAVVMFVAAVAVVGVIYWLAVC